MNKINIAIMAMALGASVASADILSKYVVEASTTKNASLVAADTTASTISSVGLVGGAPRDMFGSLAIFEAGTFGFYSSSSGELSADPVDNSEIANHYIGFTTTADAGKSIQLSSLTFDWGGGANNKTVTTTFGYRVFANVDDTGWISYGSDEIASATYTGSAWSDFASGNIDLSGVAKTADGGNVGIRIQTWSSLSDSGTIQAFKDVTLSGTVIPEPATLGMLAVFGGGLLVIRRRLNI